LIEKGRLRRTTQQSIAAFSIGGMVVARTMVDSALLRMNCAPPAQQSLSILAAGTRRANRKTVNPKDSDRSAWPSDSSSRGDANHTGARLTFSPSLLCPDDDRSLSELPRPRHLRTDLAPHLVAVPIGICRLSVRTRNAAMMFIARRSGGIPAIVSGRRAQADFWPEMTFELLVTQPESVTCYSPS
jgi:hypothetical protein